MPSLDETQRLFWRLITAPEGVAAALAADAERGGGLRQRLLATVRGSQALDAEQRLDIYANMYFYRLFDVLKDEYPALVGVLGEIGFHNLITDYLLSHPPRSFSVRHAGDDLPPFIATHAASAAHPYLAELAAFERALTDAFDAADQPAVPAAALAGLPPEAWPGLRLHLHSSVRLLRGDWAVQQVRQQIDHGEPAASPSPTPTRLCIWREELQVRHRSVDADEFDALLQVAAGARFAEIGAAIAGEEDEADAAGRLAALLAGWLAGGYIAAIDPGD